MEKDSKIYIAGHNGLVGKSIENLLKKEGYKNILNRSHNELDLRNQRAVEDFFEEEKPEYVFDAAAKVGGIKANSERKAEFIYENLQIQNNIIHSSYKFGVKKLLFLASNCIYPKNCKQPMKEEFLLTGPPEPTNDAFAIAKIAGITMCQSYNSQYKQNFISVIPANLFGQNDNFDLENSHFVAALIRKFHEAKLNKKDVILWGTGKPRREIMHVDDLADACLFLMQKYDSPEPINIGSGYDLSIKELAGIVKKISGFDGKIFFDETKPDGIKRKLLDSSKINSLGWKSKTSLDEGLKKTYEEYLKYRNELEK